MEELFEAVDVDPIAQLLRERDERRATLERIAATCQDDRVKACLPYFIEGAEITDSYNAGRMFSPEKVERAFRALDADYWQRAFDVTDVLSVMPAIRREEWHEQIKSLSVPPFTEEALQATLAGHLAARPKYFAERVDGLFRALSPSHKTNLPTGFRSKLILNNVFDTWGDSSQWGRSVITDLRIVVAKFMGRNDIGEGGSNVARLTGELIKHARQVRTGEWVSVDGGAIEIKAHKVGTCHVRVHDEIAWRLNAVLAYLHPSAIPESQRTRPKRGKKKGPVVTLVERPLPFAVVRALANIVVKRDDPCSFVLDWHTANHLDKHVRAEVNRVMESIGAAMEGNTFRFDYDAREVLGDLVASGVVPDEKSFQFYPTPPALADRAVDLAEIEPDHRVLEPSAGQGGLADFLPPSQTTCVEISELFCKILRSKGFSTVCTNFLKLTFPTQFDRVVMNPPFDRGQWVAHVEHAASMVIPGGRLVAILPASAPTREDLLPGWSLTWSEPVDFPGTSIRVVILVADAPK